MKNKEQIDRNISISLQKIKDTTTHVHQGIEILLVVKGTIVVESCSETHMLENNDVILINRRNAHNIKGKGDNLVISLYINNEFLYDNCIEVAKNTYICNSTLSDDNYQNKYQVIRQILTQIMLLYFKKDIGYDLMIMSKVYNLLNHIVLNFKVSSEEIFLKENANNSDERIERILNYISENYTNDISLMQIANAEYLSMHYLSKLFKSKIGINFHQYLSQIRMEKAIKMLMESNLPINKISLECGFPNNQSFNREFHKRFNQNPSDYRKKNNISVSENEPQVDDILTSEDNNLSELLKYIISNDLMDEDDILIPPVDIDFSKLDNNSSDEKFNKIVRIGKFKNLLNDMTRKQLTESTRELNFKYIYFEDFFIDNKLSSADSYFLDLSDTMNCINFIRSLKLIPIVGINMDKHIENINIERSKDLEIVCEMILSNFYAIKQHFSLEYLSTWFLEFKGDMLKKDLTIFEHITNLLIEHMFSFNIGVSLTINMAKMDRDMMILKDIKEKNIIVNFVTIESTPNTEEYSKYMDSDNKYYEDYLKNQVQRLKDILKEAEFERMKIFVTSFNTLAGTGLELAGSFFRAALILSTIINTNDLEEVSLSYWLSVDSNKSVSKNNTTDLRTLSLYLIKMIKRPVYYVLKFLNKCGANLHQITDNVIMSTNDGEYYILVLNPFYYNPLYSIEENYISNNRKNMIITVKGLESGEYLIKRHTLNKEKGGRFEMILNLMSIKYLDAETIEYVEKSNMPDIKVLMGRMDNEYSITANISSNAVMLYEMKKIF